MAKKEGNQGRFQTAGPPPRDESGVDVRDLLAFAAGKKAGESVTREDIDKIITQKGVSNRDARRIRKGADQFFNSGLEYRVTGGGRYNVNNPVGAETKASRRAGDKAGFNAGDLVKLGRNVSTLIGLADLSSAGLAESKKPKNEGEQTPPADKTKGEKNAAPPSPDTKKKTSTDNIAKKKTFIDPDQFTLPPLGPPRLGDKPKGLGEYAKDYKGPVVGAQSTTTVSPTVKDEGNFWPNFLLGDLTKLADGQNYKDLGTVWNPAQIWSQEARDKAVALAKAHNLRDATDKGYTVEKDAKNNIVSMSGGAESYSLKDGKLVDKDGKPYMREGITTGMPNMGIFTPTPGKVIGGLKTPQFLKSGANKAKQFAGKAADAVSSKLKSVINPSVAGAPNLPNPSSIVSMKQAQQAMKEVQSMNLDRVVKENWLKKMSDFIKANKDRLQQVDDAEMRSYDLDLFKKGGKLPMGDPGMKFDPPPGSMPKRLPRYNPSGPEMDFGVPLGMRLGNGFVPYQSLNNTAANYMTGTAGYKGTLNVGRAAKLKEAGVTPVETALTRQGTHLSRKPQLETEDLFGKDNIAGDVAGKVAKYALPFIGEGLARKELNKIKPAEFKTADFMTGAVRDLPRPNMNLRYREPVGPDVQSEIAGQKFADAQARDAEANYQIQNSMSKLSQLDQNLNRTNQGIYFNTQGKNQNSMFNAQMRAQVSGARADSMKEPFIAAQQHLATDISTGAYLSSARKSQLAEEILKYETPGSPRYEQAVRWLAGSKAKGGKLKS